MLPAGVHRWGCGGVLGHYLPFFANFTNENDTFSNIKEGCQPLERPGSRHCSPPMKQVAYTNKQKKNYFSFLATMCINRTQESRLRLQVILLLISFK